MKHTYTRLVLLLVACGLALLSSGVPTVSAAPADSDVAKLMLVMDASGSMAGPAEDGGAKIDAAKAALDDVVDKLPKAAVVGFRVFGATAEPNTPAACTDSQLTAAPATGNRDQLKAAIAAYTPKGETPISYALQQAAADLGSDGVRSIVLVSDGVATCEPDPCVVAGQIKQTGIDLKIDVVGLGVAADPQAIAQLQCVANAGGGTYYDAGSTAELSETLAHIADRATRAYKITGQPVTGTQTATGAPTITAGSWSDLIGDIGSPDAERWYEVKRKIPGSTLRISSAILSGDGSDALTQDIDAGGKNCVSSSSSKGWSTEQITQVSSMVDPRFTNLDKLCVSRDVLLLHVTRGFSTSDATNNGATALQLTVVEEAPVASTAAYPAASPEKAKWIDPASVAGYDEDPVTLLGGDSLPSAPTVGSGAYSGTLASGEAQIFKVHLDWGDMLSTQVVFPDLTDELDKQIGDDSTWAFIYVFDPSFTDVADPSYNIKNEPTSLGSVNSQALGTQTSPVAYLNRPKSAYENDRASLAGDYYVMVSFAPLESGNTVVTPYTLEVGITTSSGKPHDGSATSSGGGTIAAKEAVSSSSWKLWTVGAVAVLGVVCVAGGLAWQRRRRASSHA